MPLVSVICTARDAASTVAATVDSVIGQTVSDWEMIVVNDGSTDGTPAILEAYRARDARVRVVHTPGIGRGRALNLALARARAAFVANIDADDECHPRRLELQLRAMRAHSGFAVLGTEKIVVRADQRPEWPEIAAAEEDRAPIDVTWHIVRNNPILHSSMLADRAALTSIGGYDKGIPSQFDYDLLVRLVASGQRLARLPMPLVAKRLHSRQSFENKKRLAYLRNSIKVQRRAIAVARVHRSYLAFTLARFLFGLMPLRVRLLVRRMIPS